MCIGITNLALFRSLLHINATRKLGCKAFNAIVAAFSLDILGLLPVLCFYNAQSYRHNFLECSPELQTTSVDLNLDQPRMPSSSKNPSGPFRPKMTSSFTKQTPLTMSTPTRTTPCPQIGPPAQHLHGSRAHGPIPLQL